MLSVNKFTHIICSGSLHSVLSRVHNTTQGLALRRISRALTLVTAHWNARIDSDPIYLCVPLRCVHASDQNILANLTQCNTRPCVNIVNPPLGTQLYNLQNALNIVPLNRDVTEVKKVGYNGFAIGLVGKDKLFRYVLCIHSARMCILFI